MLPFYKTFPFMDYYKNEDAFATGKAFPKQEGVLVGISSA